MKIRRFALREIRKFLKQISINIHRKIRRRNTIRRKKETIIVVTITIRSKRVEMGNIRTQMSPWRREKSSQGKRKKRKKQHS